MRGKHHYTIIKITYTYLGDYLDEGHTKTEKVVYTTNKREKANRFYAYYLNEECGCEYKGVYYPYVEIVFRKDY